MLSILTLKKELRIPENNDWVIFILLGCVAIYLFVIISLQRDSTIKGFVMQKFADSSNVLVSWILLSLVFCLAASALISQYIPFVPKFIAEIQVGNLQLNKFGITFIAFLSFYLLKAVLGYFFFHSVGSGKKWQHFYFVSSKFYFVASVVLLVFTFVNYFIDINHYLAFQIYIGLFAFIFIFKQFYYLLNPNDILPNKWYYKFLYICTLQIAPIFALWKLLFI